MIFAPILFLSHSVFYLHSVSTKTKTRVPTYPSTLEVISHHFVSGTGYLHIATTTTTITIPPTILVKPPPRPPELDSDSLHKQLNKTTKTTTPFHNVFILRKLLCMLFEPIRPFAEQTHAKYRYTNAPHHRAPSTATMLLAVLEIAASSAWPSRAAPR